VLVPIDWVGVDGDTLFEVDITADGVWRHPRPWCAILLLDDDYGDRNGSDNNTTDDNGTANDFLGEV